MSLSVPVERLSEIREANKSLIQAFEGHPQFTQQQSQRQGKIYFMWDFANRTNVMLDAIIDNKPMPDTPATRNYAPSGPPGALSDAQKEELSQDAVGRCTMLHMMMTDTSPMASMMFGEAPGSGVDIGDAVRGAADNLIDLVEKK